MACIIGNAGQHFWVKDEVPTVHQRVVPMRFFNEFGDIITTDSQGAIAAWRNNGGDRGKFAMAL